MRHPGCVPTTESVITDRIYAGVAAIAAVLTVVESPEPLWTIGAVLVALVPWALVATRHHPPALLFLALAVLPVVAVVGVIDDKWELSAATKLVGLVVAAVFSVTMSTVSGALSASASSELRPR